MDIGDAALRSGQKAGPARSYNFAGIEDASMLALLAHNADRLTKRQLEVLRIMRDGDQYEDSDDSLLVEGLAAYIGLNRTNRSTVNALLWCMAITTENAMEREKAHYYYITNTGREILRAHGIAEPATPADAGRGEG